MIDCLDAILTKAGAAQTGGVRRPARHCGAAQRCTHAQQRCTPRRFGSLRIARNDDGDYGLRIAAPVVALLSRSVCAFAASFSA